jgi:endonuclease-3
MVTSSIQMIGRVSKKIIPEDRWIRFSHHIVLHGRVLCVARKPQCPQCQLNPLCYAKDKTV